MLRPSFVVVLLVASLLAGCGGSAGDMRQNTGTDVSLHGNNYKIVRASARGQSSGFYLLGIIHFCHAHLCVDAKTDLYKSVGQTLEGRSIALANQTSDNSNLYLILFSIPRITITADVVEFTASQAEGPEGSGGGSGGIFHSTGRIDCQTAPDLSSPTAQKCQ